MIRKSQNSHQMAKENGNSKGSVRKHTFANFQSAIEEGRKNEKAQTYLTGGKARRGKPLLASGY